MGWTVTFASSFAEMKKQYIVELTASGRIKMVSTYGNWFHCINTATDRPFVIYMLTSSRNHEYAYKDMSSDMGFFQLNYRAASWLKRELMKRNMAPLTKYEADWILRSERKEATMTITEETLKHVLDMVDMGMSFTTEGATLAYLSNYGHTRAIIDLDANTFMITVGDSDKVIERGTFTNDDDPVELLSDIANATGNIDMAIESAEETIHPYQD